MSGRAVNPSMMRNREVIIAVNPSAGATATEQAATELLDLLTKKGLGARIESNIETIIRLTKTKSLDLRAVVAAGGDGTIALLANRLPPTTPFAILPQGTENLLAKHLLIPNQPEKVADMIGEGLWAELDAGRANGQLFLVMASCGFDAEVVHQVHKSRKGHIRHWAYAKPIINSIRKYRYPTVSIYCDEDKKPIRVKWAFVFNVPRYAMGLPIAEDADGLDGYLDLCAFRGGNLINGLVYLFGVVARRHRYWRDTRIARARRFRIQADDAQTEVPYQVDGDPGGYLPLTIEVVPKRLKMIVPRQWAIQHKFEIPSELAVNG